MRRLPLLALFLLAAAAIASPAHAQTLLPTDFTDLPVVAGLDFPVGMARLPDGRVLVVEQFSANVRLIVNGALALTDPVCTIDQVRSGGEQGLLGIAVDPGWPSRPYIYIQCDATSPGGTIRISRYEATGDLAFAGNGAISIDVASRRDVIQGLPDAADNHNGGTLRFGLDGMLYSSVGDDAQNCMAQDDSTLHGVILRLDVSRMLPGPGGPPSLAVITPIDNAQIGATNAFTRLIDAWGFRNPFRFQIDSYSGARFIGDVGQSTYEEVDRAPVGGLNFGWPYFEGPMIYNSACDTSSALTAPIAWYDRSIIAGGAAVIMGPILPYVVSTDLAAARKTASSASFPLSYAHNAFFSDYYHGFLRRLIDTGSAWVIAPPEPGQPSSTDWGQGFDTVSDWMLGADGGMWYCRQGGAPGAGEIRRIVYTTPAGGGTPSTDPLVVDPPFPQPSPGAITIPLHLVSAGPLRATIHDLRGQIVRQLADAVALGPGDIMLPWDGFDDRGDRAPSGFYVVRIEAAGVSRSRRIVLVR